jgi:phage-related protein
MPGIGGGVRELRIHEAAEYRVIYLASLPEAVYVLHAFQKQSRRTRWADLELARRRLRELKRGAGGAP